jgi:hypothetical protein
MARVLRRANSAGDIEAAVVVWRNGQFEAQPFGKDFSGVVNTC